MKITSLSFPVLALGTAALLTLPELSEGGSFTTIGGNLSTSQRDVRIFNNFTDAGANNNQVADANFPGYQGVAMAIWKSCVEWGSRLHGDGNGDPHQPFGLGSGGANFDITWQGNANSVGGTNDNTHSELAGGQGGVLAFTETPISDGWRIRYYSTWNWADGPGTSISGIDAQGVSTHEFGHALGLGHSGGSNTMAPSISGSGVAQRSIGSGDIDGVQFIYGVAAASKPVITAVSLAASNVVIDGSQFTATGNQVWFTQASSGGTGSPVSVSSVASTNGGTRITVQLPANAGPGDVLVKKSGSGHSTLSNAWPFDPGSNTCPAPVSYCQGGLNSSGLEAFMSIQGSSSVTTNNFILNAFNLPPNVFGIFFYGPFPTQTPFGEGFLCTNGGAIRLGPAISSDLFGQAFRVVDLSTPNPQGPLVSGSIWFFQMWYRDAMGGPNGFNLTDGAEVAFCD